MKFQKEQALIAVSGALLFGVLYYVMVYCILPSLHTVLVTGAGGGWLVLFSSVAVICAVLGLCGITAFLLKEICGTPLRGMRDLISQWKVVVIYIASVLVWAVVLALLNGLIALLLSKGLGTGEEAKAWVDGIAGGLHFLFLPFGLLLHPALALNDANPIEAAQEAWRVMRHEPWRVLSIAVLGSALGLLARLFLPGSVDGRVTVWSIAAVVVLSIAAGCMLLYIWRVYLASEQAEVDD